MKLIVSTIVLSMVTATTLMVAPTGDANALFLAKAFRAVKRAVASAKKKVSAAVNRARNTVTRAVNRTVQKVKAVARSAKRLAQKAGATIRGLFNPRFVSQIRNLLRFRFGREIAKLRAGVREAKARAARMLDRAKKSQVLGWVKKNWGPVAAGIAQQAKAWQAVVRSPAARQLIRRIILRVLQRRNDASLRRDVKALASMYEAATGKATTRRAPAGGAMVPGAAALKAASVSTQDIKDCQHQSGLAALNCILDHTHPTRAVMFGLAAGLVLGLHGSLGVVWKGDKIAFMLCGGGLVGAIQEIEPQAYYSYIKSEPSAAGGFGVGVAATAALGIGIEGSASWSIEKGMSPAPDFNLGGAIGEGLGVAFDATYCLALGGK